MCWKQHKFISVLYVLAVADIDGAEAGTSTLWSPLRVVAVTTNSCYRYRSVRMEYHARWASQLLADVGTEFCRCCDIVWRTDGIPIRDTLSVAVGSGPFVKYVKTQQGAAHADRSQMVKTAGGKLEFRLQFALKSFEYGLTVRPNMKMFLLHFTKSTTSFKWLSQTADIVLQNCFFFKNQSNSKYITWIIMRRYQRGNPFQQTFNISCDASDTVGIKFWQFIRQVELI